MITGFGNYLIEINDKLVPVCSSSFSLVKNTENKDHFSTDFSSGIKTLAHSNIHKSSWTLTINDTLSSHLVLTDLISAKYTESSLTASFTKKIVYDGISPKPIRYYNLSNPNVVPVAGDILIEDGTVSAQALLSDNSENLQEKHKFYGFFYDTDGLIEVHIDNMFRVSNLSIERELNISFIAEEVKFKGVEAVEAPPLVSYSLILPKIPEAIVQSENSTYFALYGKLVGTGSLNKSLSIYFEAGTNQSKIVQANLDGTFGPIEFNLNNSIQPGFISNFIIIDIETDTIIFQKSIEVIKEVKNLISIDPIESLISGSIGNYFSGTAPSNVPIEISVSSGEFFQTQTVLPKLKKWTSSLFTIPHSQESINTFNIYATSEYLADASQSVSLVKNEWSFPAQYIWNYSNNIFKLENQPPNKNVICKISENSSITSEVYFNTDNNGYMWFQVEVGFGSNLSFEFIIEDTGESFITTVIRSSSVIPVLSLSGTAPYLVNKNITGTVTAPIGTSVLVGYGPTNTSSIFINHKMYLSTNGTINFSLKVFPVNSVTSSQKTACITATTNTNIVAVTETGSASLQTTIAPSLIILPVNETTTIATTETFSINLRVASNGSKTINIDAFGIVTNEVTASGVSSLTKIITIPSNLEPGIHTLTATCEILNGPTHIFTSKYIIESHLLAFKKTFSTLILSKNNGNTICIGTGRQASQSCDSIQSAIITTVTGISGITTINSVCSLNTKTWTAFIGAAAFTNTGPYTLVSSGVGQSNISFSGIVEMKIENITNLDGKVDDGGILISFDGPNNRQIIITSNAFAEIIVFTDSNGFAQFIRPNIEEIGEYTVIFSTGNLSQQVSKKINIKEREVVQVENINISGSNQGIQDVLSVVSNSNASSIVSSTFSPSQYNTNILLDSQTAYRQVELVTSSNQATKSNLIEYSRPFTVTHSLPAKKIIAGLSYSITINTVIGEKYYFTITNSSGNIVFSSNGTANITSTNIIFTLSSALKYDVINLKVSSDYVEALNIDRILEKNITNQNETIIEKNIPNLFGWYSFGFYETSSYGLTNSLKIGEGCFYTAIFVNQGLNEANYRIASASESNYYFNDFDNTNTCQVSSVYPSMIKDAENFVMISNFEAPLSTNEFTIIQYLRTPAYATTSRSVIKPLLLIPEDNLLYNSAGSLIITTHDINFSVTITGQRPDLESPAHDSLLTCTLFEEVISLPFLLTETFTTSIITSSTLTSTGAVFITRYKKVLSGDEVTIFCNSVKIGFFKFNGTYEFTQRERIASGNCNFGLSAIAIYTRALGDNEIRHFCKSKYAEAVPFRITNTNLRAAGGTSVYPNSGVGSQSLATVAGTGFGRKKLTNININSPLKIYEKTQSYFKFNGTSNAILINTAFELNSSTSSSTSYLPVVIAFKREGIENSTLLEMHDGTNSRYTKVEFDGPNSISIYGLSYKWSFTYPIEMNESQMVLAFGSQNSASEYTYNSNSSSVFKVSLNGYMPTTVVKTSITSSPGTTAAISIGVNFQGASFFKGNVYLARVYDRDIIHSTVITSTVNDQNSPIITSSGLPAYTLTTGLFCVFNNFNQIADIIQPARRNKQIFY